MTTLEYLRALIPNAEAIGDETLEAMIALCEADFLAECGREDVPAGAESVIAQMAAFRVSQRGSAGLQSESFSGASESYLTDYPETVRRAMHRFRKARAL